MESYIARLPELAKKRVERNLEKLENRGFGIAPPLAEHVGGEVYALYIGRDARRFVCIAFYFDEEHKWFRAFSAQEIKGSKLSRKIRAQLLKAFEDLTRGNT